MGKTASLANIGTIADSSLGFRNRIINGAMVIDQRNAGASVTVNSSGNFYACDRFVATGQTADGVFTIQQSTTAPTGFKNSLVATVTTADASIGASQYYIPIWQKIEGLNVSDLGWGTANAASVTLSFWVRSSVTGTFGGAIQNSAQDRSYPFSYTINSANTWEQKTVTIAGDTSGTWLTTNGVGLGVLWSIGVGSTLSGAAGAWAGAAYLSATGATSIMGTVGNTFYITGVQLEKGSTATSFDYRPYGTELALCQRYYYKWINDTAAAKYTLMLQAYSTTGAFGKLFDLPVTMRTQPTATASGTFTGINSTGGSTTAFSGKTIDALTAQSVSASGWTGSSGLVAGNATVVSISASAYIEVTAEL